MNNLTSFKAAILRICLWSFIASLILAMANVSIPKYAPVISFVLGTVFLERESKRYKNKWLNSLLSSGFLSLITVAFTYIFTIKICAVMVPLSFPTTYCSEILVERMVKMEGASLMAPWIFILLMFVWYRVIFRHKYF